MHVCFCCIGKRPHRRFVLSLLAAANAFVYCLHWAGTFAAGAMHSCVGTLQCVGSSPLKRETFPCASGLHLIHGSLDPHESAPKQHLNRSSRICTVHPCVQHTYRHTDTQTTLRATSVATGRIYVLRVGDAA